jgi:hypothetical protein
MLQILEIYGTVEKREAALEQARLPERFQNPKEIMTLRLSRKIAASCTERNSGVLLGLAESGDLYDDQHRTNKDRSCVAADRTYAFMGSWN